MKSNKGTGRRKSRGAVVTTLCFGLLMMGSAQAQWAVTDPAHTAFTNTGWYVQGQEYLKQAERWKQEAEHYKQQLADAKNFFKSQDMTMTMDFSERILDYGMAESCPGAGKIDPDRPFSDAAGRTLSAISSWRPLKLDNSANLKQDMLSLCARIVTAQNMKYNETIRLLKHIKQRDDELNKLDGYRRGVGENQGKLATSSNQLSAMSARLQMDVQYAETVIHAYDEYINNLVLDQEKISKRIMKGSDKTLASVVLQGAAMKGTFAAMQAVRDR